MAVGHLEILVCMQLYVIMYALASGICWHTCNPSIDLCFTEVHFRMLGHKLREDVLLLLLVAGRQAHRLQLGSNMGSAINFTPPNIQETIHSCFTFWRWKVKTAGRPEWFDRLSSRVTLLA